MKGTPAIPGLRLTESGKRTGDKGTGERYSRVRKETEDSDVDLLVKFDRSLPIGLFAYIRMHRELEEKLGRKVDLVEEGTLRPAVQKTANRDLKIVYERSN